MSLMIDLFIPRICKDLHVQSDVIDNKLRDIFQPCNVRGLGNRMIDEIHFDLFSPCLKTC